jgi:S1-C subfamily serine protease
MHIIETLRVRASVHRGRHHIGAFMAAAILFVAPVAVSGWLSPSQGEAAAPPAGMQSFADIVKKVTPAVVNVAVVHSVGLAVQEAPAVLEVLPVVAMNRPVWNHPVLRHFPALLVLTDDRNRVPDPV